MERVAVLFDEFDFSPHYRARYEELSKPYSFYEFAYRFGYELAMQPEEPDDAWHRIESAARREWRERYPTLDWIEFRDAVRCAWQLVKNARREE